MLVTAIASILMVIGWYACRTRIREIAETREGFTGKAPVIANRTPIS
jgi:L-asparagine permease